MSNEQLGKRTLMLENGPIINNYLFIIIDDLAETSSAYILGHRLSLTLTFDIPNYLELILIKLAQATKNFLAAWH